MKMMKILFFFTLIIGVLAGNVFARPPISERRSAAIFGQINKLSDGKKITIEVKEDVYYSTNRDLLSPHSAEKFEAIIKNNSFVFEIPFLSTSKYSVISYDDNSSPDFWVEFKFIIEPGDSISITGDHDRLVFSGRNSAKYSCEYELSKMTHTLNALAINEGNKDSANILSFFHIADSIGMASLRTLETFKNRISPPIYSIKRFEIIRNFESAKASYFAGNMSRYVTADLLSLTSKKLPYLKRYTNVMWNTSVNRQLRSDKLLENHPAYLLFVLDQYRFDSSILRNRPFDGYRCYEMLQANYTKQTFDRLLYLLVSGALPVELYERDRLAIARHALKTNRISSKQLISYLKTVCNLSPGVRSYEFCLKGLQGQLIKQSDFLGKTVLLDFWYVGCAACIKIQPILDSIAGLFNQNEFKLISICVAKGITGDYTSEWIKAVNKGKYTTEEHINVLAQGEQGIRITQHYDITGYPSLILIDKKGNITEPLVNPGVDRGESILNLIRKNH